MDEGTTVNYSMWTRQRQLLPTMHPRLAPTNTLYQTFEPDKSGYDDSQERRELEKAADMFFGGRWRASQKHSPAFTA